MESIALSLDSQVTAQLFHSISVENTIVDLTVGEGGDAVPTLVREIQTHPFRPDIFHVDFLRIQEGVAVDVGVPVVLSGTPVGVSLNGGNLEQIVHEIPVRCLPSKIPESFEVDVSELDIGDSLHLSDLEFDDDLEVLLELEQTVCNVTAPRVIEEEEVEEEEELEPGVERIGEEPDDEEASESDED